MIHTHLPTPHLQRERDAHTDTRGHRQHTETEGQTVCVPFIHAEPAGWCREVTVLVAGTPHAAPYDQDCHEEELHGGKPGP